MLHNAVEQYPFNRSKGVNSRALFLQGTKKSAPPKIRQLCLAQIKIKLNKALQRPSPVPQTVPRTGNRISESQGAAAVTIAPRVGQYLTSHYRLRGRGPAKSEPSAIGSKGERNLRPFAQPAWCFVVTDRNGLRGP